MIKRIGKKTKISETEEPYDSSRHIFGKASEKKAVRRKSSIKLKITLLVTILMAVLFILLLTFMLIISRQVASQTAMQTLSRTVQNNLSQVSLQDSRLQIGDNFTYSHNGVSTLIYSQSETLLAGQIPVTFTAKEPFRNGLTRIVESQGEQFFVMDLWMPSGWDDGVWIRGLIQIPAYDETARNLVTVAMIALPVFILLTALGSWMIIRRTFRPLENITKTAATINEARDLSGRIGLPPGSDEFSRLASEFDAMFERLETSFEAERQFTADASHELRTPVSIIKSACEYAEKYDETPDDHQETIAMIHRQADKMASTISQLLSMTRLEQGIESASMNTVDLADFVRSACEEKFSGSGDDSRLTFDLGEKVMVRADVALLTRLLDNLLENAFKYGKPGGYVLVSVRAAAGEALLSVKDDGIGISPEHQEKIWQRFYQVDSSRGVDSGVGLGLAMVRQIAAIHGGSMTLESTPGTGSTFTLHLPLLSS